MCCPADLRKTVRYYYERKKDGNKNGQANRLLTLVQISPLC